MSRARRRPLVLWAAVATLAASAVLGALVTATRLAVSADGETLGGALQQWALWSALSLPVGFVFGALAFVIGRALWRARA